MRHRTILLVDDEPDSLAIYSAYLQHAGYGVLVANSPDDAHLIARSAHPNVIVTELFQRTRTGWLTVELLKTDPSTAHIPLLVVSAHVMPDDRERAILSGSDIFLEKPLEPRELGEAIAALLS